MDPFIEAAAELGCDQDAIEGTFPPAFVGRIRQDIVREQWRKVVTIAYNEITGGHVSSDFPEPTLAILFEGGKDETSAVLELARSKKACSIHDGMRAVDNALRKIGAT